MTILDAKTCAIDGCGRKHMTAGLCAAHYSRRRRDGDVRAEVPVGENPSDTWGDGLPGNPWAGHTTCPTCGSTRWTMPRDGSWGDNRWLCVARDHPTRFFRP